MQRNYAICAAVCLLAFMFSGCENWTNSIYREASMDSGASPVTDAKQRVVVNTAAGGEDQFHRRQPKRIFCAEPSPDVAQALSESITAAIQAEVSKPGGPSENISGNYGSSAASSVAQLGERLASIQLLRDKMYRACEAYANGAIGPTSYTLMLSRIDKTMATLLASELAGGEFGRNLATLSGSAGTSGVDQATIAKAQDAVTSAAKALSASAALNPANPSQVAADADSLNAAVANLTSLEMNAAKTAANATASGFAIGQIQGLTRTSAPDQVALIHERFIDDGGIEPVIDACITEMSQNSVSDASRATFSTAFTTLNSIKQKKSYSGYIKNSQDDTDSEKARSDINSAFLSSGSIFAAFCATNIFGADFITEQNQQKLALRKIGVAATVDSCNEIMTSDAFKSLTLAVRQADWSACIKKIPDAAVATALSPTPPPVPLSVENSDGSALSNNSVTVTSPTPLILKVSGGTPPYTPTLSGLSGSSPQTDKSTATPDPNATDQIIITIGPKATDGTMYALQVSDKAKGKLAKPVNVTVKAAAAQPVPLSVENSDGSALSNNSVTVTSSTPLTLKVSGGTQPYTPTLSGLNGSSPKTDNSTATPDPKAADQIIITIGPKATDGTMYALQVSDKANDKLAAPVTVTAKAAAAPAAKQ